MPFFTLPPEDDDGGGEEGAKAAEAKFVEGFGKEFDVEAGDAEVGVCFSIPVLSRGYIYGTASMTSYARTSVYMRYGGYVLSKKKKKMYRSIEHCGTSRSFPFLGWWSGPILDAAADTGGVFRAPSRLKVAFCFVATTDLLGACDDMYYCTINTVEALLFVWRLLRAPLYACLT